MSLPESDRRRILLRVPIILMVLAGTAFPIELRPLSRAVVLGFSFHPWDILQNIAGYLPVGFVLASLGLRRAVAASAGISILAETAQLFMMHRDVSLIDVAMNVTGGTLGVLLSLRWKLLSPSLAVRPSTSLIAAALAIALGIGVRVHSGDALNMRGITSPGTLEAHWKFDEAEGQQALDSSGNGLHGEFRNEPQRVSGVSGGAVALDGKRDYIDFGRATPFRLSGSMTISAWIKASSFPFDDSTIVSNRLGRRGYQLSTTPDLGPRTIGFKLTDACGGYLARYGRTALAAGVWYHIAGVYNAEARTLDVYLNGKSDNGLLAGKVTGRQRSSRVPVYIGRRNDDEQYNFAGSIDDVRIYSRALTRDEIGAGMGFAALDIEVPWAGGSGAPAGDRCLGLSDEEDSRIPGVAVVFGVLVALACAGLLPSAGLWTYLMASFIAGWFLIPTDSTTLPVLTQWLMPFFSLTGGASIALGMDAPGNSGTHP